VSRDYPMALELPAEGRAALRRRAADAVEWLLAILDALDADPDLEPAGDESEPDDNGIADHDGLNEFNQEKSVAFRRAIERRNGDPAEQARTLLQALEARQ